MSQESDIISFFSFSNNGKKIKNSKILAWISSDYFESLLLPQLLRGENDSKQSDEFQASKISLLAVYRIFCIFEADFKIRKMKKWSIFLTIFFFSIFVCILKYVNMTRISNISCFRFCWKNEKLDWPKCARTVCAAVKGMVFKQFTLG